MEKFIYVFTQIDADRLASMQYTMLISDEANQKFVFLNDGKLNFSEITDLQFVMSDVLTFQN